MSQQTPRLALPLLDAGQAQKELYHNEALILLDAASQAAVRAVGTNAPPADPAEGDAWIVGDAPGGDWSGHARALACRTAGGWRFVAPPEGMTVWARDAGMQAIFSDGAWSIGIVPARSIAIGGVQVVGARQPAIAAPAGGTVADDAARAAIAAILAALRTHGLIAA